MMRSLCLSVSLLVVAGCGGSSSESPWPREPANLEVDPSGEKAPDDTNVVDVDQLPDNYSDDEGEDGAGGNAG